MPKIRKQIRNQRCPWTISVGEFPLLFLYKYRLPVLSIRNLIRNGNTPQIANAVATSAALGGQTMDQALVKLVREGSVSRDTALSYAHDENYVKKNAM